jgi:septal ring factor EnvC (AmiA/AmiB activator)
MATITELRAKRAALITDMKNKEDTVKQMDKDMRAVRGAINKLKLAEKELTAQITKLAKEEL